MMHHQDNYGIEVDNIYMEEHAKRGWDDMHFVDRSEDGSSSSPSQADLDENDIVQKRPSSVKKRAIIFIVVIAAFAAILGLGYGIGYGIGAMADNRDARSSNMNAVTIEDCMGYYTSSNSVPTYSPTTYSPTASPISEEDQLVAMFFPVFSNDMPIITDDDEVVTPEEGSNSDVSNGDGPVRRLGSPTKTDTKFMSLSRHHDEQRVSTNTLVSFVYRSMVISKRYLTLVSSIIPISIRNWHARNSFASKYIQWRPRLSQIIMNREGDSRFTALHTNI